MSIGRALAQVIGLVFVGLMAFRPTVALAITVAVVPFDNGGPAEMDGLSVGLQSMVTTDLSAASAITVVERARLQDLLAEMELGEQGVLDPATAVRIGKVSGATHVVAGSFTVVGDQMRLDARLAEVGTGTITVAAEQSGERDAFFELEKALVKSLLTALGAELSPKERAAVSRLHTADFDQLKRFGEGVALYDADRYAEAIAVLEDVARSDADFKLAAVTLADVEQVRDAAEKKAQAVRLANAEAAFVVHQQDARAEAELVEALQSMLKDDSLDWRRKATLNLILSWALQPRGGLRALSRSADEFALARRSERAFQAYWSLVREQVPSFWPKYRAPRHSLRKGAAFELDYNVKRWFPAGQPEERFAGQGMWSCDRAGLTIGDEELKQLWVPLRRRLDLHLELLQEAAGCEAVDTRHETLLDVANAYARLGAIGDAVAILDQLAKESTDERILSRVAHYAGRLAERQKELSGLKRGTLEDELVRIGGKRKVPDDLDSLRSDVEYYVRAELPFTSPMFVGGVPVWRVASRGARLVGSGRRTHIDETDALVYYRPAGLRVDREPVALHVIGGVPMASGTASVTVDFEPHPDFYPLDRRGMPPEEKAAYALSDTRPLTGVLVGLRELRTPTIPDPADPKNVDAATSIPTTGIGVLIREGTLILARVEERPLDALVNPKYQRGLIVSEVLVETPLKTRGPVEITATVDGTTVIGRAGEAEVRTELDEVPTGFVGWMADGEGFVGMSAPALRP